MATTRRSLFGWLFGAAAALPALPVIAEAATKARPKVIYVNRTFRGPAMVLRTKLPSGNFMQFHDKNWLARRNELLEDLPMVRFRGVPVRVIDKADD